MKKIIHFLTFLIVTTLTTNLFAGNEVAKPATQAWYLELISSAQNNKAKSANQELFRKQVSEDYEKATLPKWQKDAIYKGVIENMDFKLWTNEYKAFALYLLNEYDLKHPDFPAYKMDDREIPKIISQMISDLIPQFTAPNLNEPLTEMEIKKLLDEKIQEVKTSGVNLSNY